MEYMPNDPNIMVSYVNMKLRDQYSSLNDMCEDLGINRDSLEERLREAGFTYDSQNNRFN